MPGTSRALAVSLLTAACATPPSPIDAALARGTKYLLAAQSEDGAWRSPQYSALREGYALTPVELSVLLFASPLPGLEAAYARGVDFTSTLSKLKTAPIYPVYSLAGALLVLSVPLNARHAAAKEALIARLLERQLTEERGWSPADPSYGGWGYYDDIPVKPGDPAAADDLLSANIASTLFAIGALQLAGRDLDDPVFPKALQFVTRCQNYPAGDGGFFFTPANDIQNKAGRTTEGGPYRSYGTATADGLRALLRLGVSRDDPRAQAAGTWLMDQWSPDRVPGDYPPDREVQRDSAYHYWAWTSAHALLLYGPRAEQHPNTKAWPEKLARALLARQKPDGSWQNAASDLREDDPLVATPLAMSALAICRLMRADGFTTAIPMPAR